jgi:homoserine O-acetyltransferase
LSDPVIHRPILTFHSGPAPSLTNPYASLISQSITTIPSFTLESGVTLHDVPVAYKTWGKLNPRGDNCLVICHALTGSADVEDWWGPLLGVDRAFDPTRWFIFCGNVIGSPYGTISSLTTDRDGRVYGPEMSGSSVKDDVR